MIRALLVEDEERSMRLLYAMLRDLAPDVEVIAREEQVDKAIQVIDKEKPDLVFLDIELNGESAFGILDGVTWKEFQVIFVTAYESYALKAIGYSAADYLLKPIDAEDLKNALEKARKGIALRLDSERMALFRSQLSEEGFHKRISLPTLDGFIIEELENIRMLKADGNYTLFHFINGEKSLVSKNIREFESLLEQRFFFRIHRSYMVNLRHVKKYIRGKGGHVVLSDSSMLPVAIRKREAFLERLKQL